MQKSSEELVAYYAAIPDVKRRAQRQSVVKTWHSIYRSHKWFARSSHYAWRPWNCIKPNAVSHCGHLRPCRCFPKSFCFQTGRAKIWMVVGPLAISKWLEEQGSRTRLIWDCSYGLPKPREKAWDAAGQQRGKRRSNKNSCNKMNRFTSVFRYTHLRAEELVRRLWPTYLC